MNYGNDPAEDRTRTQVIQELLLATLRLRTDPWWCGLEDVSLGLFWHRAELRGWDQVGPVQRARGIIHSLRRCRDEVPDDCDHPRAHQRPCTYAALVHALEPELPSARADMSLNIPIYTPTIAPVTGYRVRPGHYRNYGSLVIPAIDENALVKRRQTIREMLALLACYQSHADWWLLLDQPPFDEFWTRPEMACWGEFSLKNRARAIVNMLWSDTEPLPGDGESCAKMARHLWHSLPRRRSYFIIEYSGSRDLLDEQEAQQLLATLKVEREIRLFRHLRLPQSIYDECTRVASQRDLTTRKLVQDIMVKEFRLQLYRAAKDGLPRSALRALRTIADEETLTLPTVLGRIVERHLAEVVGEGQPEVSVR